MRRWLPWAVLAVSVAFNLFFAIGALVARARHARFHSSEGRARMLADELGLDGDQRAQLVELDKRFEDQRRKVFEQRWAEDRRMWEELAKDEPDERILEELASGPGAREGRKLFLEHARALVKILRPEQRARLVEVMERHHRMREGPSRPPPPHGMPPPGAR